MLSYQSRSCDNCNNLEDTICLVDDRLSCLTTALYKNTVFMTSRPFDRRLAKDLIYYKEILGHLLFNSKYYSGYTAADITSKIKTLV